MRKLLIALVLSMLLGGCGLDGAVTTRSDTGPGGSQRESSMLRFEESAERLSLSENELAFLEAHKRYMREHAAWAPIGSPDVDATLDAAHFIATRLAALPELDAFAFLAGELADVTASDAGTGDLAARTVCSFATNAWLLQSDLTPWVASRITARAEHAATGLTELGEAHVLPDWLIAERDVRDSLIDIAALVYTGRDPDDPEVTAEVDYRIADHGVIRTVADFLVVLEEEPGAGADPGRGRPVPR